MGGGGCPLHPLLQPHRGEERVWGGPVSASWLTCMRTHQGLTCKGSALGGSTAYSSVGSCKRGEGGFRGRGA